MKKLNNNYAGTFDILYYFKHPTDNEKSGLLILDYKTNNDKVKIICKNHGIFEQRPRTHLSGHGCNNCSKETTLFKKGTVLNLSSVKQGTEIVAQVTIRNQSDETLENVALSQIVPSGFEDRGLGVSPGLISPAARYCGSPISVPRYP